MNRTPIVPLTLTLSLRGERGLKFSFSPAGVFGGADVQVEEVFLLVESDAIKIYILTYLQKFN